jgi:Eukaryotic aspartyl protease
MAVATNAAYVPRGIMGIGFDADESIASNGGKPYHNIIDVMVQQKIINTRAYSLWLDNLGMFIRTRLGNLAFSIC